MIKTQGLTLFQVAALFFSGQNKGCVYVIFLIFYKKGGCVYVRQFFSISGNLRNNMYFQKSLKIKDFLKICVFTRIGSYVDTYT